MTDTEIRLSLAEQNRRLIIRSVMTGQMSPEDAAGALGVSAKHVHQLRRRFEREGDAALVDRRTRGLSKRTPTEVKAAVIELVRANYLGQSCAAIRYNLAEKHAITVEAQSLRRWLLAEGIIKVGRKAANRHASGAGNCKLRFRFRAVRLRTWLAQVQVSQPTGPSPALMAAFKATAEAAAEFLHLAKYEVSAHEFLTAFESTEMSCQEFTRIFPSRSHPGRYRN